jgi:putative transposase
MSGYQPILPASRKAALRPRLQEFEHIRKRYWGQRFWGRGYFSTTAGNITEDIIMGYLDRHILKEGFSPSA